MMTIKFQKHPYTLVELLVAMAILVLMMGFLFQFIGGANKLWRGSTKLTDDFENANIMFTVLRQDYDTAVIRSSDSVGSEPAIPWGFTVDSSTDDIRLAFIGYPAESPKEMALILYRYDADADRLYRKVFTDRDVWYGPMVGFNVKAYVEETTDFGLVDTGESEARLDDLRTFINDLDTTDEQVLAEHLTDFDLATNIGAADYDAWNKKAAIFRVTAEFESESVDNPEEKVVRRFRKNFLDR